MTLRCEAGCSRDARYFQTWLDKQGIWHRGYVCSVHDGQFGLKNLVWGRTPKAIATEVNRQVIHESFTTDRHIEPVKV